MLAKQLLFLSDSAENNPAARALGEHESADDLDQLLASLLADHAPRNSLEHMLVERLAACFWRLRRAYRFETASIVHENQRLLGNPRTDQLPHADNLDKLLRYESLIDRELN